MALCKLCEHGRSRCRSWEVHLLNPPFNQHTNYSYCVCIQLRISRVGALEMAEDTNGPQLPSFPAASSASVQFCQFWKGSSPGSPFPPLPGPSLCVNAGGKSRPAAGAFPHAAHAAQKKNFTLQAPAKQTKKLHDEADYQQCLTLFPHYFIHLAARFCSTQSQLSFHRKTRRR